MRIVSNIQPAAGAPPAGPEAFAPAGACNDVRCGCGSLLARIVGAELELKCRRCKQVWRLAVPGLAAAPAGGAPARWRLLEGSAR